MKKAISIIVATLLLASLVFMPGCKQHTVYEGDLNDSCNTVTLYEFANDLKAGQKIDRTMLKEIKVDLNATAFVTNGGISYSLDNLNGMALLTPDYFDEIITDDAYVAASCMRGQIVKIGIIQKSASAFVDAIRLIECIAPGELITEDHLELVLNINPDFIPKGTISDPNEVIGKYAAIALHPDTYLTPEDIYDNELQVTLRNIAEELLEIATFHGMFTGPFEDKIVELQNRHFQFNVEYSAEEWFNKDQKKIQLGDAMTVTVSIDPKLSVSVVGCSQKYHANNDSVGKDVDCVRLRVDISKGSQITANHLEIVSVPDYSLPAGVYRTAAEVIGKYATSQLYAGDYLTPGKLSDIAPTIEDTTLGEGKQAMSVQISSFAGSLSGRLQSGDIVTFWVRNENGEPYVPEELQYVMVIAINTGDGIDKDQIIINDDGSFAMPSTVTVIVSEQQAARLVACSGESIYLTLVYRGNEEQAQKYLDMQDEILEEIQGKTP